LTDREAAEMLNIQQIEALRKANPQLYEALKRLAGASLGPNQGWSLDNQITDGTNFARVSSNALTANQIDPTKSGVLMRGSVPPTWSGAFTYASTTSSLTWSWSGLAIYRADGTSTAIPNGSVAVTGLTTATTYYFYPYWDETANALAWVPAGSGSPAYAQSAKTNAAAQQQALQGRIPLSQGAIAAATTSSGTGGGSGGGSGSCLRAGTMVLTRERGTVAIETCTVGEHLRCPSGGYSSRGRRRNYRAEAAHAPSGAPSFANSAKGESVSRSAGVSPASSVEAGAFRPPNSAAKNMGLQPRSRPPADENPNEAWTRIVRLEVRDADTFIRLHFSNAESLDVTPHHIFTLADGSPMRAERLCLSDILVGRFARLTLTKIEVVSPSAPGASRSAGFQPANLSSVEAPDFLALSGAEGSPAKRGVQDEGLQPRASGSDECWQKVTVSCEPSHEFFAGRHSASILTHNYTFSS
jgi:hypothetical protein